MTTLILSVFFAISASAYDVEVDGIYYNTIEKLGYAEVTKGDKEYEGDITIPSSFTFNGIVYTVSVIGNGAFRSSTIKSISIPSTIKEIKTGAFDTLPLLEAVYITDLAAWCSIKFETETSAVFNTSYLTNLYLNGELLTNLNFPEGLSRISPLSFYKYDKLKTVSIPNTCNEIGNRAFAGCKNLNSINLPNSVNKIEYSAFANCEKLNSIKIPNSVTEIGDFAFENTGIISIQIPNSVSELWGTFYDCKNLETVEIPLSLSKIGVDLFGKCKKLKTINIPESIEMICEGAFAESGLEKVEIPQSVKTISKYSFSNCTNLKEINLNSSIKEIGEGAFWRCKNIENVYCYAENIPSTSTYAFHEAYIEYATLHVPATAIDTYKNTVPWSGFGKFKTLDGTEVETKQCATPTISYSDDKLHFACETEGAECYYTLNSSDIKSGDTFAEGNSITLGACYDITCYAIATGYKKSDVATAKLYWLPSSGTLEGDNINNVAMRGIAIQSAGGFINISGLDNNEKVDFYGVDGKALGSARSIDGSVSFSAKQGSVVVAKIGKETVKIAVE